MTSALTQAVMVSQRLVPATNPLVVGSDPPATGPTTGWAVSTYVNRVSALVNGAIVRALGLYNDGSAVSITLKIVRRNSPGDYDVLVTQTYAHPAGGWSDMVLTTPYIVPMTGTFYIAHKFVSDSNIRYNNSLDRANFAGDATGNGVTFTESTGAIASMRARYY